jgi:hypothetical protein
MNQFIKEFSQIRIHDIAKVGGKTLLWVKCIPNSLKKE